MNSPNGSSSSTGRSKRRHEPKTLEEAWRLHCKHSFAGSLRAAWKYAAFPENMPPSLVDYAEGGRYFSVDPPPRPMRGPQFEKWRAEWEMLQQCKRVRGGESGSGGGGAAVQPVAATAEEEEAAFLAAVELSKKDAEAAARAEAEEEARALADVEAFKAMEAAGDVVFID